MLSHPLRSELETTQDEMPIEPVMQLHLQALPPRDLPDGSSPDVKLPGSRGRSGPAVSAIGHRRTAVIAAAVEIELQRFAAGPAGCLGHPLDHGSGAQLQAVTTNHVARQQRPGGKICQRTQSRHIQMAGIPVIRVVGTRRRRVHDQSLQRFKLQPFQPFSGPPLVLLGISPMSHGLTPFDDSVKQREQEMSIQLSIHDHCVQELGYRPTIARESGTPPKIRHATEHRLPLSQSRSVTHNFGLPLPLQQAPIQRFVVRDHAADFEVFFHSLSTRTAHGQPV